MEPGDFVTTPNWTWHDHGHEGDGPMIWLDGLDQPIVECFEAWFWESYEKETYPLNKPNEVSQRMYGGGSMRPTWTHYASATTSPAPDYNRDSPLVNYKYAQAREMLFALTSETDGSPYDGYSIEYTNPVNGGPTFATMACFSQLLRTGQHTKAHRHVGSVVYHVVEGKGHTIIDGVKFNWEDKDTFVVPGWTFHEHVGESDAVLFSYTDTPITQNVGIYREEAYAENDGHQKVTDVFKAGPKS
jgi:gentisate 1,2-dioxygenase